MVAIQYRPSFEEIKELRKEIVLNSLFVSEYENSMGFDPNEVCNFFDGYVEHLADELEYRAHEEGRKITGKDYFRELFALESDEELACWYIDWQEGCGGAFTMYTDVENEE